MKILLLLILGLIIDANTKEPLVGVRVESEDKVVYTDFNGNFKINSDSVEVSYISYTPVKVKNDSIIMIKFIDK